MSFSSNARIAELFSALLLAAFLPDVFHGASVQGGEEDGDVYINLMTSLGNRRKDIRPLKISVPPILVENPTTGLLDVSERDAEGAMIPRARELAGEENADRENLFRYLEKSTSRPAGLGPGSGLVDIRKWYSKRRSEEDDETFPKTILRCAGSAMFAESLGRHLAVAYLEKAGYGGISTDSVWRRGRAVVMVSGRKDGSSGAEAIELVGLDFEKTGEADHGHDVGMYVDPLPPGTGSVRAEFVPVAVDGVTVVVHPGNPVRRISIGQLKQLLVDGGQRWNVLEGGGAELIRMHMGRETASFLKSKLALNSEFPEDPEWYDTDAEVETAILRDTNGIGMLPMAYASRGENKPLPMSGAVEQSGKRSTMLTVLDGGYSNELTRMLYFRLPSNPIPVAREFVEFSRSGDGQRVVMEAGYAPRTGMNGK